MQKKSEVIFMAESSIGKSMEDRKADSESRKERDRQFRRTLQHIDDVFYMLKEKGIVGSNIVEDGFYRKIRYILKQKTSAFSSVKRNLRRNGVRYDIVAVGENRVLIVEMQNRMKQYMVDEFLNGRIPKFRQTFPEYRDSALFGGMAALVVPNAVRRYAQKKGLYVLTQNGEGGAMLVNRQNFRAKEF